MTHTAEASTLPSQRLRSETAHLHQLAEQSPFQRDLAKGRLDRAAFARHLGQMRHVHAALEQRLWALRGVLAAVDAVVRDEHRRVGAIDADLAHYGLSPSDSPPLAATADLVADIHRLAEDRPLALLGMHYVLEGSMNGARFIAGNLRAAYGLAPGVGDRYMDPYGERQREVWAAFKRDLDACDLNEHQIDDLLDGARRMFNGVRFIGDGMLAAN